MILRFWFHYPRIKFFFIRLDRMLPTFHQPYIYMSINLYQNIYPMHIKNNQISHRQDSFIFIVFKSLYLKYLHFSPKFPPTISENMWLHNKCSLEIPPTTGLLCILFSRKRLLKFTTRWNKNTSAETKMGTQKQKISNMNIANADDTTNWTVALEN